MHFFDLGLSSNYENGTNFLILTKMIVSVSLVSIVDLDIAIENNQKFNVLFAKRVMKIKIRDQERKAFCAKHSWSHCLRENSRSRFEDFRWEELG